LNNKQLCSHLAISIELNLKSEKHFFLLSGIQYCICFFVSVGIFFVCE